jgi:hypothetical protein
VVTWVLLAAAYADAQSSPSQVSGVVALKGSELVPGSLPGRGSGASVPDFRFLRGAEQTEYSFAGRTEAKSVATGIPTKVSESKHQELTVEIPVSVRGSSTNDSPSGGEKRAFGTPGRPAASLFAKEAAVGKEITPVPQVNRPAAATAPSLESARPADNRSMPPDPSQAMSLYGIALVYLLSNLTTLIIGVLLFAGAFWFLLRRLSAQLDALSRLRLVSVESAVPSGPLAGAHAGVDTHSLASPERFDLGMTYQEEMQQRNEAAREQEQAVLRQIFEQNIELRKEIGALSAA